MTARLYHQLPLLPLPAVAEQAPLWLEDWLDDEEKGDEDCPYMIDCEVDHRVTDYVFHLRSVLRDTPGAHAACLPL